MPRPSSATDTATCTSSRTALTLMEDDSGECLAALESRLPSTCTIRSRSAITRGRSGSMSMSRAFPRPALLKALIARSTSTGISAGSGLTESVPVSMRATSSRAATRSCMWSACSSMMRKNWRTRAGSTSAGEPSTVAVEPLMEVRGARSSWLTVARNSARSRSISLTSAMSCRVITIDSTSPPSERMGVALSSTVTLRPSGASRTISSLRTVSPALSSSARGSPLREGSRPSLRRKVTTPSRSSGVWCGSSRLSTIRSASGLRVPGVPVAVSMTATPTGEVSIRVSRSPLARCSSRYRRALAMTIAACEENMTRISSSSPLNVRPSWSWPWKMTPTDWPRCLIGADMPPRTGMGRAGFKPADDA